MPSAERLDDASGAAASRGRAPARSGGGAASGPASRRASSAPRAMRDEGTSGLPLVGDQPVDDLGVDRVGQGIGGGRGGGEIAVVEELERDLQADRAESAFDDSQAFGRPAAGGATDAVARARRSPRLALVGVIVAADRDRRSLRRSASAGDGGVSADRHAHGARTAGSAYRRATIAASRRLPACSGSSACRQNRKAGGGEAKARRQSRGGARRPCVIEFGLSGPCVAELISMRPCFGVAPRPNALDARPYCCHSERLLDDRHTRSCRRYWAQDYGRRLQQKPPNFGRCIRPETPCSRARSPRW